MLRDRFLLPRLILGEALLTQTGEEPVAHDLRVRDRLQGRERLRSDDHEGRLRVEIFRRLARISRVDVRNETAFEPLADERLERLIGHDGAEVGAADTDIHDCLDRFAGDSHPLS